MAESLLIVEDEFIVANDLRMILERAGYTVCGIAASFLEAREMIDNHNVDLVLLDIHLKGKLTGIDLAGELKKENIPFVYLSANSNQQILEAAKVTEPQGFLVKPYREKDVLITFDIARYRHRHSLESKLRKESSLYSALASLGSEPLSPDEKFFKMVVSFQTYLPFDCLSEQVHLDDGRPHGICSFLRIGFNEYQSIGMPELSVISGRNPDELNKLVNSVPGDKMAALYNGDDFGLRCKQSEVKKLFARKFNLESELSYPIFTRSKGVVTLSFFSRNANAYNSDHLALLTRLQQPLIAIFDETAIIENEALKGGATEYNQVVTRKQTEKTLPASGIVGHSDSLLYVMDLVAQVAPLDTSVLILGESGTGKERIADCIHSLSPRKSRPLVKINCAALPPTLVESELFGHEKGSFTGATDKKIGKFELASGGTIFLDEIGDLPLDQQVKLLRVLQEREIERIGGNKPIKVDVRVVAATNRNLEREVAERRFRLDLYYRLNVFPIVLPPLRERKEDISQLAEYFAARFCRKFNKAFHGLTQQMIHELEGYRWPGNVRELENIIEQSVILNDGRNKISLKRPLPQDALAMEKTGENQGDVSGISSLLDIRNVSQRNEKEYICSILKKTNGRIRGKGGAAELLNQKPTTLESRIARLGIKKEDIYK